MIFLMVPVAGFAAGWTITLCYLVLRNAPYGRYPDRRFVTLLEFLHRGTMVAAIIAALILQVAMLLTQPPVVAAAHRLPPRPELLPYIGSGDSLPAREPSGMLARWRR